MLSRLGDYHRLGIWARVLPALAGVLVLTLGDAAGTLAASSGQPTITLSPASGPPGTTVTIRGTVPGMTAAGHTAPVFTVCLNGCVSGFTDQGTTIRWTGADTFVSHFTIPRIPVLTASGPLVPRDGVDQIGVTCVKPQIGGCLGVTQAHARFRVTHAPRPTRCGNGQSCGDIRLSASRLYPGQIVRISGCAPLTQLIGQPFPYTILLSRGRSTANVGQTRQDMNGNLTGSFRVPALASGLGQVTGGDYTVSLQYQFNQPAQPPAKRIPGMTFQLMGKRVPGKGGKKTVYGYELVNLAKRPFTVRALPAWSTLARLDVHSLTQSQALPFAVLAGRGTTSSFAYCVPGGIEISRDSGKSWALISTTTAAAASMQTAFPIAYSNQTPMPSPTCQSVSFDPSAPDTLYASFLAINRQYGSAPPFYRVLYETLNGGSTWTAVPGPKGYVEGDFGGIAVESAVYGSPVVALYSHIISPQTGSLTRQHTVAIATTNGGRSWHQIVLSCPVQGPCVRFGALPGALPGMGTSTLQPLLRSTYHGRIWNALAWPSGYVYPQGLMAGLAEIAWLGGNDVAFVSPGSQFPLRISRNGGRSWQAIALPLPPDSRSTVQYGSSPYGALMLLPDGHLLASLAQSSQSTTAWYTLSPRATHWVRDAAITAPRFLTSLFVSGKRIFWPALNMNGQPSGSSGLHSAPLP